MQILSITRYRLFLDKISKRILPSLDEFVNSASRNDDRLRFGTARVKSRKRQGFGKHTCMQIQHILIKNCTVLFLQNILTCSQYLNLILFTTLVCVCVCGWGGGGGGGGSRVDMRNMVGLQKLVPL